MRPFPIVAALAMLLLLSSCSGTIGRMVRCETCTLDKTDKFTAQDRKGVLVFGLTVEDPGGRTGPVEGKVTWLADVGGSAAELQSVDFPDRAQAGRRMALVLKVEPGVWSLRQVKWEMGKKSDRTQAQGGLALATDVVAGEVTYAGDLVVEGGQLKLLEDEAATQSDLASYPGIQAPFNSRILRDQRIKARERKLQ